MFYLNQYSDKVNLTLYLCSLSVCDVVQSQIEICPKGQKVIEFNQNSFRNIFSNKGKIRDGSVIIQNCRIKVAFL